MPKVPTTLGVIRIFTGCVGVSVGIVEKHPSRCVWVSVGIVEKHPTGRATCSLTIGIEPTALPDGVPVADILPATPPG